MASEVASKSQTSTVSGFIRKKWRLWLILALTLGLAPIYPEPHLFHQIGKIFAASILSPQDWFDLLFHSLPWALVFLSFLLHLPSRKHKKQGAE